MVIYIINFCLNMLFGLFWFRDVRRPFECDFDCVGTTKRQKIVYFFRTLELGKLAAYDKSSTTLTFLSEEDIDRRKRIYLLITTVQLGLLCGLRSTKMAYDTESYATLFWYAPDSLYRIFDNKQYFELGFSVFCTLVKVFGGTFQCMLIISALFIIGSACIFIYRHSKNVLLSVFIIVSFPFYYSSFDIIRHFMALSFVYLGYKYILENKFSKYLLFIALGSLFHTVAWLFLPLYFLKRVKYSHILLGIVAGGTAFAFVFLDKIAMLAARLLGKSSGLETGWMGAYAGGVKTAIMYGLIFLMAFYLFHLLKEKTEEDHTSLLLILLLLFFAVMFINARMMTRFMLACIPFLSIAMPQLLDKARTKNLRVRNLIYLSFIGVGSAYHLFLLLISWQKVVPYIPFFL